MRRPNLDEILEMWARWLRNGCNQPRRGYASLIEMMMKTQCHFITGGGPPPDHLETSVETAVGLLGVKDELAAVVIRVEYGALAYRGIEAHTSQMGRAHALGITLRTYERKLAKARQHVEHYLHTTR